MTMREIPCRECITLSICKAIYGDYSDNLEDKTNARLRIALKCSLIQDWIDYASIDMGRSIWKFHDFFRGDWDGLYQ